MKEWSYQRALRSFRGARFIFWCTYTRVRPILSFRIPSRHTISRRGVTRFKGWIARAVIDDALSSPISRIFGPNELHVRGKRSRARPSDADATRQGLRRENLNPVGNPKGSGRAEKRAEQTADITPTGSLRGWSLRRSGGNRKRARARGIPRNS